MVKQDRGAGYDYVDTNIIVTAVALVQMAHLCVDTSVHRCLCRKEIPRMYVLTYSSSRFAFIILTYTLQTEVVQRL